MDVPPNKSTDPRLHSRSDCLINFCRRDPYMEASFHQPPHPGHLALCSPPSFHMAFPHLGKECSAWKYFVLGYGKNLPVCLSCNLCSVFYSYYLAWLFWVIPFAHFGPYPASKTPIILLWDAGERSLLEPAAPSWALSMSPDINNLWLWVTEGL